jgi:hypothetical protein
MAISPLFHSQHYHKLHRKVHDTTTQTKNVLQLLQLLFQRVHSRQLIYSCTDTVWHDILWKNAYHYWIIITMLVLTYSLCSCSSGAECWFYICRNWIVIFFHTFSTNIMHYGPVFYEFLYLKFQDWNGQQMSITPLQLINLCSTTRFTSEWINMSYSVELLPN